MNLSMVFGSVNLVEFLSRHVNATIGGTGGSIILGMEVFMWVWRHVMLVGSSRGLRGPRFLTAIMSDAGILEQGEVVVIPYGGSRSAAGEANELLHGLNHPKFRDVVDSGLEEGQPSGIGEGLLCWRYFIQLSEQLIEVEDKSAQWYPTKICPGQLW